jgi:hypothetical protein
VTILDYSSPRPRSKLRLPSLSRIVCQIEPNQLVVQEWLQARGSALGGICFALFILAYLGAIAVYSRDRSIAAILMMFWLAEALVMLLLIHQTWRRTLLTVTAAELRLEFTSPFYRKEYRWDASNVADVVAVVTANAQTFEQLAELRIQISNGQDARLFTDHPAGQIDDLVAAITEALNSKPQMQ